MQEQASGADNTPFNRSFEATGEACFDFQGNLLGANETMRILLGYEKETGAFQNRLINPRFEELLQMPSSSALVFEGLMTVAIRGTSNFSLHAKVYRDHKSLRIQARPDIAQLLADFTRISLLNQEVSELHRTLIKEKKRLSKVNDELKHLTEEMNRYVGMVAHDLRNPIGGSLGLSELVLAKLDTIDKEELRFFLREIKSGCKSSLELIHKFLDTSKIKAGVIELHRQACDYADLVRKCVEAMRPFASHKSQVISVHCLCPESRPSLDPDRITQVLNNLLSNAIKYSPKDTAIHVAISEEDETILTQVIDTGQGIPAGELDNIFKPFKRSSAKPTDGENSTGLGLAIVKKIVEAHGGTVAVTSSLGQGSDFNFRLPLNPTPA